MIWIASFPRSGNTFFRNVLKEVYNISSSSYHKENYGVDPDCFQHDFIKTHLLPHQLPSEYKDFPAVYLIRDGRDAVVSTAFHRKNFIDVQSSVNQNMVDAIIAKNGTYFGGWSINVCQWIKRADIIIRFEDLIIDPIAEIEKIRKIYPNLPSPRLDMIPTFESQKLGNGEYGVQHNEFDSYQKIENFACNFFRKGKQGAFLDEMPRDIEIMFWHLHGKVMERMGYDRSGAKKLQPLIQEKSSTNVNTKTKRVLIEASPLLNPYWDGNKRYINTLLKSLVMYQMKYDMRIDFFIKADIVRPIESIYSENFLPSRKDRSKVYLLYRIIILIPLQLKKIIPRNFFVFILNAAIFLKAPMIYRFIVKLFESKMVRSYEKNMFDLFHLTYNRKSIFNNVAHDTICTVHDLTCNLYPQFHNKRTIVSTTESMKELKKNKSKLISVSNHTKKDIKSHYDFKDHDIHVVFEAIDHEIFFPNYDCNLKNKIQKKYKVSDTPYFLSFSTLEPRKNLENILKAFLLLCERNSDIDMKFLLAGRYGWKMKQLPKHKNIIRTGHLTDENLRILSCGAVGVCYVSHYEGFGLPPLEAMRCKTAAIYGNNSSMKELIGDSGLPADSNDPIDIMHQMEKLLLDPELRSALEEKAYKKSWEYNMEKLGEEMIHYYLKVVPNRKFKRGFKT